MNLKFTYLFFTALPLWLFGFQGAASAQFSIDLSISPESAVATPTTIDPATSATSVQQYDHQFHITGGQVSSGVRPNVIHQFNQFDVGTGDIVRFLVDPAVANVINLIDSSQASLIDGRLAVLSGSPDVASQANLFLVNPAGVVFGENISLNLPGSLTATSASGLFFADQYQLSIDGAITEITLPGRTPLPIAATITPLGAEVDLPPTVANLTGEPTGYFFDAAVQTPVDSLAAELPHGSIHNQGLLALSSGSTLTLLGDYVQNDGELRTAGGTVNLLATDGDTLVRLSQVDNILAVDLLVTDAIALETATDMPQAITGGGLGSANQIQTDVDGSSTLVIASETPTTSEQGNVLVRGTVDVSAPHGNGLVNIIGETIDVIGSEISADGVYQAGTVTIGSDADMVTSSVNINRDADISADASLGEGGVIKIRATEIIQMYGQISAEGTNPSLDGSIELQADETDIR